MLNVRLSPRDALARLDAAINRRPRRALGLLKVHPEYVGVARLGAFEIWERRQHAIRAVGRIERSQEGARIRASFVLSLRSRTLAIAFFGIYAVAALGVISAETYGLGLVPAVTVLVLGALTIAVSFYLSARHQRHALRTFVGHLFADVLTAPS